MMFCSFSNETLSNLSHDMLPERAISAGHAHSFRCYSEVTNSEARFQAVMIKTKLFHKM